MNENELEVKKQLGKSIPKELNNKGLREVPSLGKTKVLNEVKQIYKNDSNNIKQNFLNNNGKH